jgi:hypothetical protein
MYTVLLITIGALFLIYLGIAIAALLRPAPTPRKYPDYTLEFIRGYVQELVHNHLMEAGIIVTRAQDDAPLSLSPDSIHTRFCLDGRDRADADHLRFPSKTTNNGIARKRCQDADHLRFPSKTTMPYRIRLVNQRYVEPRCGVIIRELRRIECVSVIARVQVCELDGYPDVTIDIVPR